MTKNIVLWMDAKIKRRSLAFFAGEDVTFEFRRLPVGSEVVLTVAADVDDPPLLEAVAADRLDLSAQALEVLPEDSALVFNVWHRDSGGQSLKFHGLLRRLASVEPDVTTPPQWEGLSDVMASQGSAVSVDLAEGFSGAALSFALAPGAPPLPTGLSLSAAGVLSGTPQSAVVPQTLTVQASNGAGMAEGSFGFSARAVPGASRLIIEGDSVMANAPGSRDAIEAYVGHLFAKPAGYQQAVGGQTAQAILSGLQATIDLIVPGETVVLVGPVGANQSAGSSTFSEISAQLVSIYDQLLAAGAVVVAIPTLPDSTAYVPVAEKNALRDWVYAYQTGGTVAYDGGTYSTTAHANFYAVDIGTRDANAVLGPDSFDPDLMKTDQSHPNTLLGAPYLARKTRDVLEVLGAGSVFDGTNLITAGAGFEGAVTSSGAGVTGVEPSDWAVTQTLGTGQWTLSKDGDDALVASITNAPDRCILQLRQDVSLSGALGDVFDLVSEIEIAPGSSGYAGTQVALGATSGGATASVEYGLPEGPIFVRTQALPLTVPVATETAFIRVAVLPGGDLTVTFKQAAAAFVETVLDGLEITGTPAVSGQVGDTYSFVPTVTGGTPPYVFDLASGQLPGGLSLTPSTGAITGTLTSQETQSGIALRVTDAASDSATLSPFTLEVTAASVPVNTGLPTLSGAPEVGAVLSCAPGAWTNSPTGYAYQWRSSGFVLTGETASTYTIVAGDVGQTLTCDVIASNANGAGSVASSLATGVVTSPGAIAAWESSINSPTPLQFAYSDSGRTVTATADIAGIRHTRGADALSGRVYFEVEATSGVNAVGVASNALTYLSAGATNSGRVFYSGSYLFTGSAPVLTGALSAGDLVQVAVDTGAGLIWFRNATKATDWNANASADPATGAGGLDVSGLSAIYAYTALSGSVGAAAVLHGTSDRFTAAAPSGFLPIL